MELKTDFEEFLAEVRPTQNQRSDARSGHRTLRQRLNSDEGLKPILVSDFLQGSYKRSTAVRPKGDRKSDVDIIVVTRLSEQEHTPAQAMDVFKPFLEKHYKDKWKQQGRSFGIELSYVKLDLVITAAPSEAQTGLLKSEAVVSDDDLESARDWRLNPGWLALSDRGRADASILLEKAEKEPEWKTEPLRIPDRDANVWDSTNPLEQIRWTRDKNARCQRHFINVVKAVKWWRLENYKDSKYPKGFPLERIVGDCCPDIVTSVARGLTETLEQIVARYATHALQRTKPVLPDYGVPEHDVLARISVDDFQEFYGQAEDGAKLARRALDCGERTESGNLWRDLLGNKFPKPPGGEGEQKAGFTPPSEPAVPGSGRFAK